MSNTKYRIVYESTLYNASETMEILKKCPPDVFFKLYHKYKKELHPSMNNDRTTLSQRMDRLEININQLSKIVTDGFAELRQDIKDINTRLDGVESRLDGIDTRLDYVVKANNLKDRK